MNILMLGGTGFLGTGLARALAAAGHEVVCVARSHAPAVMPLGSRFVQATIDDRGALAPLVQVADYVFHLAWDTTPGTSLRQPSLEADNNFLPTLHLIDLLQEHPHSRLVFLSTGGAMYSGSANSVDESAALAPRSYYGATKAAVEMILGAYHAQTGNTTLILRPSNIYGPGQLPKRDFGIIPTIMSCLKHGVALDIWGDGEAARDFLYIGDFECFVLLLTAREWPRGSCERFNLGSGAAVSINALCAMLERVSGRTLLRRYHPARSIDYRSTALDSTRARAALGWSPATPIGTGLQQAWEWFLAQP